MGTINATKLTKELKASRAGSKIRKRSYSGGNVSGRLIDFRCEGYECQINLLDSGRIQVLVGRVITGVPKQGWLSGDWVAFGNSPLTCPELGNAFLQLTSIKTETNCFYHSEIPDNIVERLASLTAIGHCLTRITPKTGELLVITPEYLVCNLLNRGERDILYAFDAIVDLAQHFPTAPQPEMDEDDPTD